MTDKLVHEPYLQSNADGSAHPSRWWVGGFWRRSRAGRILEN